MAIRSFARPLLIGVLGVLCSRGALAAHAQQESFGTLTDGTHIEAVVLSNGTGMVVRVMTLGATIQSLSVPDRRGRPGDIVLGFSTPQQYVDDSHFFGATVGRFANRIVDATTVGKYQRQYREGDALVFEPQLFPDAPNHPNFPSARLEPGQTYQNTLEYRFSTAPAAPGR
jgi:galactose mutarotase-like enzyme